jgi:murein DD-endopeptidase MepM/ murein hydrolase activator NlpD
MTRAAILLAAGVLLGAASQPAALPPPPIRAVTAADFELDAPAVQGGLVRGRAPEGTLRLTFDGEPVAMAPDRSFVIGFDRDHSAVAELLAHFQSGSPGLERIAVAPRSWRIERVSISQRPPAVPDEAYRLRRAGELARIRAARAERSEAAGWRQRFVWPSVGRISGLFGSQRVFRGVPAAYHSGVDVAGGAGAPIVSPADGVVVLAGPPMFSLEGNLVIVDHGMGLNSAFLHLSRSEVRVGQRLRQGERIGAIGATGRATGPHLHWSLMWNGARLDPQLAAGPMGAARP